MTDDRTDDSDPSAQLVAAVTPVGDAGEWSRGVKLLVIGLAVLIVGAMSTMGLYVNTLIDEVDTLRDVQDQGIIRGYRNRAVECSTLATQLGPMRLDQMPDVCMEDEILAFYDPEQMAQLGAEQDSEALRFIICSIDQASRTCQDTQ